MRASAIIGLLGVVVAWIFIIASITASPWFNFYNNALSDLGNLSRQGSLGWVFNSGLILSGIMVASFGALLTVRKRAWSYLCWTVPLTLAGLDMALVGFFSEDYGMIHGVVSVILFSLVILTMLLYSYASWPLGAPRIGALSLFFAILSLIVWFVHWPWRGVAIQETISSILGSIWLILVALKHD